MGKSKEKPIRVIAALWESGLNSWGQFPPPWELVPGGVRDREGSLIPHDAVAEAACLSVNAINDLLADHPNELAVYRAEAEDHCRRAIRQVENTRRQHLKPVEPPG